MGSRRFHEIWIEQCKAAEKIKLRYGPKAAFDYVVAEKLLNFADVATRDPEFARELPRFVARVRGLFTVEEMRAHLKRIELAQREHEAYISGHDEFDEQDEQLGEDALSLESPAAAARARRFATIAELLSAAELGTS
jgi:hypothetical protein